MILAPASEKGSHYKREDPQGTAGFDQALPVHFNSYEPMANGYNGHGCAEPNDEPDDPLTVNMVMSTFFFFRGSSVQGEKSKVQAVFPGPSLLGTVVTRMITGKVRRKAQIQGPMITFLARLTVLWF